MMWFACTRCVSIQCEWKYTLPPNPNPNSTPNPNPDSYPNRGLTYAVDLCVPVLHPAPPQDLGVIGIGGAITTTW